MNSDLARDINSFYHSSDRAEQVFTKHYIGEISGDVARDAFEALAGTEYTAEVWADVAGKVLTEEVPEQYFNRFVESVDQIRFLKSNLNETSVYDEIISEYRNNMAEKGRVDRHQAEKLVEEIRDIDDRIDQMDRLLQEEDTFFS